MRGMLQQNYRAVLLGTTALAACSATGAFAAAVTAAFTRLALLMCDLSAISLEVN